jgi:hypothetical protein
MSVMMNGCKKQQYDENIKIRIVGHSLAARVILSSLDSLNKNIVWNNSTNN